MIDELYPTKRKKQNSKCPNCGCQISSSYTFESALSGKFDNPGDGAWSVSTFSPIRKADVLSDICVPAGQAVITALLVFPVAWTCLVWADIGGKYSLLISACVMAAYWIKGIKRLEMERGDSREFSYEPVGIMRDLSSLVGKKEKISLEVISKDDDFKASMKIVDLPSGVSGEEFVQFCRDILSGKSLARKEWVGSEKQFSRDDYDGLIDAMLSAGLVRPVPGKGKVLTVGGRHAIKRMLRQA